MIGCPKTLGEEKRRAVQRQRRRKRETFFVERENAGCKSCRHSRSVTLKLCVFWYMHVCVNGVYQCCMCNRSFQAWFELLITYTSLAARVLSRAALALRAGLAMLSELSGLVSPISVSVIWVLRWQGRILTLRGFSGEGGADCSFGNGTRDPTRDPFWDPSTFDGFVSVALAICEARVPV